MYTTDPHFSIDEMLRITETFNHRFGLGMSIYGTIVSFFGSNDWFALQIVWFLEIVWVHATRRSAKNRDLAAAMAAQMVNGGD